MNVKVNKHSAVPLYFQVKEAVKGMVARGELKPGDMLPSEVSLSEQLGISRLTVHRALRELVAEGLLVRQRAKGTFVALPRWQPYRVEGPLLSLSEDLAQAGLEFSNRILVQETVQPDEEVRQELGLGPGEQVVHLLSLRSVKQLPLAVEEMFQPLDRFPQMATLDLNNQSIYAALERLYGAHPHEAVDRISAGTATEVEARLLEMGEGRPVLRVRRTSYDRTGQPVEFSIVTFDAARQQFVVRARRMPVQGAAI
jgi:GntR family transcriptional regulator